MVAILFQPQCVQLSHGDIPAGQLMVLSRKATKDHEQFIGAKHNLKKKNGTCLCTQNFHSLESKLCINHHRKSVVLVTKVCWVCIMKYWFSMNFMRFRWLACMLLVTHVLWAQIGPLSDQWSCKEPPWWVLVTNSNITRIPDKLMTISLKIIYHNSHSREVLCCLHLYFNWTDCYRFLQMIQLL